MKTYTAFVQSLQPHFELREAESIARIVFEDCFGLLRTQVTEAVLNPTQVAELDAIRAALFRNQPLQYILGQADFYGLKFKVDTRVLIPRPETEELVEWVLEHLVPSAAWRILDIGTGSGCIPITLKKKRPAATLEGLDISAQALSLAAENATLNQVEVHWREADILQSANWPGLFANGPSLDCIISNPPYIPYYELDKVPPQVKDHEPSIALFVSDEDPLIFYRMIAQLSAQYLRPGGLLFFECNEYNARDVLQLLQALGFVDLSLKPDLSGKDRMLKGKKPWSA